MKSTTVQLFTPEGRFKAERETFPSAREAREAEAACRRAMLDRVGWKRPAASDATLPEIAWLVRAALGIQD